MYNVLNKFDKICIECGKAEYVEKYENIKKSLKQALNTNGWDGNWYKRAFMDSGDVLGSSENEECRIDGISQSWSVISGAGDDEKIKTAMENVERYLINYDARNY